MSPDAESKTSPKLEQVVKKIDTVLEDIDDNVLQYCSLDAKGGKPKSKLTLGQKEQEFLDALRVSFLSPSGPICRGNSQWGCKLAALYFALYDVSSPGAWQRLLQCHHWQPYTAKSVRQCTGTSNPIMYCLPHLCEACELMEAYAKVPIRKAWPAEKANNLG